MKPLRCLVTGLALVAAVTLGSCAHLDSAESHRSATADGPACKLERVGGETNPCRCSHRIEP